MPFRPLTLALVSACVASSAAGQSCPIGRSVPVTASTDASQLTGVFDLEWRPGAGPWKPTPRLERLWLWKTSATDSALADNHMRPGHGDTASFVLFGTVTEKALAPSKADSIRRTVDPIYAPVFLRIWGSRSGDYELGLLVNTSSNRDTSIIVNDGGGDMVTVTRVSPRGFSGSYGPYGIAMLDTGTACAVRVR